MRERRSFWDKRTRGEGARARGFGQWGEVGRAEWPHVVLPFRGGLGLWAGLWVWRSMPAGHVRTGHPQAVCSTRGNYAVHAALQSREGTKRNGSMYLIVCHMCTPAWPLGCDEAALPLRCLSGPAPR